MGLRFSEDRLSPGARFKTLKARLGDAFEVIEIDSRKGNEYGFGRMAHSVLTLEVREVDGHPAYEARKRVVAFLKDSAEPDASLLGFGGGFVAGSHPSRALSSSTLSRPGFVGSSSSSSGTSIGTPL